jgi:hypothetical protein
MLCAGGCPRDTGSRRQRRKLACSPRGTAPSPTRHHTVASTFGTALRIHPMPPPHHITPPSRAQRASPAALHGIRARATEPHPQPPLHSFQDAAGRREGPLAGVLLHPRARCQAEGRLQVQRWRRGCAGVEPVEGRELEESGDGRRLSGWWCFVRLPPVSHSGE